MDFFPPTGTRILYHGLKRSAGPIAFMLDNAAFVSGLLMGIEICVTPLCVPYVLPVKAVCASRGFLTTGYEANGGSGHKPISAMLLSLSFLMTMRYNGPTRWLWTMPDSSLPPSPHAACKAIAHDYAPWLPFGLSAPAHVLRQEEVYTLIFNHKLQMFRHFSTGKIQSLAPVRPPRGRRTAVDLVPPGRRCWFGFFCSFFGVFSTNDPFALSLDFVSRNINSRSRPFSIITVVA